MDLGKIKIVIGVDFGTSRSGYAYALVQDQKIVPKLDWYGEAVPYVKTLTQILYSPNRREKWFGYAARNELALKWNDPELKKYKLFRNFKMSIKSDNRIDGIPYIDGGNGEKISLLDIIADYLKFIMDVALNDINKATRGLIKKEEMLWCLTVPAIWNDQDKLLMRRAAQQAGFIGTTEDEQERLWLAYEPECSAFYCTRILKDIVLKDGNIFMVVDCGGGTVDITVHKVLSGNKLKEVVEGIGGEFGSKCVDDEFFMNFLEERLGKQGYKALDKFRIENPLEYLEFLDEWERAKCNFEINKEHKIKIVSKLYKILLLEYPDVITKLANEQKGREDGIFLNPNDIKAIFQPALNGIIKIIRKQFDKLQAINVKCDYIFIVGGFSKSPLLIDRIKKEFREKVKDFIIPPDPGAAIVEGAVSYGLDPGLPSRIVRLTYGIKIVTPFIPGIHRESKKKWYPDLNRDECEDFFDKFITVGDTVDVEEPIRRTYTPCYKEQKNMSLKLYATHKREVTYIDEPDVDFLGELLVEMPDITQELNRKVEVSMYFGKTEIKVEAIDKTSGKKTDIKIKLSSTYCPETLSEVAVCG